MSLPLLSRAAGAFATLLVRKPGAAVLLVLAIAFASVVGAMGLSLNTNQLELIDQDMREVREVERVVDMIGGAGHLIIALRGADGDVLKAVSDDLAEMLSADEERIRTITHKLDISFIRDRAALFLDTEDLIELRARVDRWLRDRIRRADPFFFEIRPTEPVELELDDIIDKYRRVGGKAIADDYYISDDRNLVILVVKPMWDTNDLESTGELIRSLRGSFADYASENAHGVHMVEEYDPVVPEDPARIEYGFTGAYVLNYDEATEIRASLVPVSGLAFLGVFTLLTVFFRRRVGAVFLVLSGLVLGVATAFGFARVAVGELNMITSILGGILLGLGIDFGIHLIYRLREELAGKALDEAVVETVRRQGPASLVSALGIGVAFFSLMLSDFRGFSEFGLLAGCGVLLIGLVIYTWVPSVLLLCERRWPGSARRMIGTIDISAGVTDGPPPRVPRPWGLLAFAGIVALGLTAFAPSLEFDYNTRALTVEGRGSMLLNDEIIRRMDSSSEPVAVFTPTLEEAKEVYEILTSDPERYHTVREVVSIFTFLPPLEMQEANAAILEDWKSYIEKLDPNLFPDDIAARRDEVMTLLSAQPFRFEDLPSEEVDRFRNIPSARPENHGYLTFIYPRVQMYDGRHMLAFADEMGVIRAEDGREWYSAGLPMLYAIVAKMVITDGRLAVILTLVMLLLILLVDLKSPGRVLVALIPLMLGVGMMLGAMSLVGSSLNFMNVVVFPIVLGYGVSHGVYLMHRFAEGTPPRLALRSVGTAVACSTLTTLAGWAALLAAAHGGLKSMGVMACLGMGATLVVSFTVMPAVLQLLHDRRLRDGGGEAPPEICGSDRREAA